TDLLSERRREHRRVAEGREAVHGAHHEDDRDGRPMSQPKVSEHTALVAARPKRTIRRPSPSESRPIELDATSPITWNAAETYDASSAALTEPAPETAKTAATKAGVHAHMPRSSQEGKV